MLPLRPVLLFLSAFASTTLLLSVLSQELNAPDSIDVDNWLSTCRCITLTIIAQSNRTTQADAEALLQEHTLSTGDQNACDTVAGRSSNSTLHLVNGKGYPTMIFEIAVGLNAVDMFKLCGRSVIKEKFNFPSFSSTTIELFVPSLALIQHLPLQAGSKLRNIFSILTAVGSPQWTAYCMALYILYGWHIDGRLDRMLNDDKEHNRHISNIRQVMRAWLQAPVRLSAVPEAIDTLVLNKRWWNDAADSLSNTQMRPDFQFLFPTTIAAAVWLWTLVAAFIEDPLPGQAASGTNLEWQISSGAISLFLFPLTYGWVVIECQSEAGTLKSAFQKAKCVHGVPRYAIIQRAGWNAPYPINLHTTLQELAYSEKIKTTVWGLNALEAEEHEGAMYAQYRIFATWRLSEIIFDAVGNSSVEMRTGLLQSGSQSDTTTAMTPRRYLMEAYPDWSALGRRMLFRMASAYAFGLLIQIGTTCGMLVMYLSPPTGIGCLSGGVLVYIIASNIACGIMILSASLTHTAMLRYQHDNHGGLSSVFSVLGVITFYLARFVAVLNSIWIVVWSLIRFKNVMQQPYCSTTYIGLRERGYTRLWRFNVAEFRVTRIQEMILLVVSLVVVHIICIFLGLFASKWGKSSAKEAQRGRIILVIWIATLVTSLVVVFTFAMRSIENSR